MKKILFSFILISLIFAFGNISFAQEQNHEPINAPEHSPILWHITEQGQERALEKIPTLDQTKNFQGIKKIGNSLFGIRKKIKATSTDVMVSSSTLEKIPSPKELNLFEKIIKIGTALWGHRKGGAKKSAIYIAPAAVACVRTAIDKKDAAVKTSITARSEKVLAAIDNRSTCQKASLDKTTAKKQGEANKICVDAYKHAITDINKGLEQERNASWNVYRADLKSCSALLTAATSTVSQILVPEILLEDGGSTIDAE